MPQDWDTRRSFLPCSDLEARSLVGDQPVCENVVVEDAHGAYDYLEQICQQRDPYERMACVFGVKGEESRGRRRGTHGVQIA